MIFLSVAIRTKEAVLNGVKSERTRQPRQTNTFKNLPVFREAAGKTHGSIQSLKTVFFQPLR